MRENNFYIIFFCQLADSFYFAKSYLVWFDNKALMLLFFIASFNLL